MGCAKQSRGMYMELDTAVMHIKARIMAVAATKNL
jgi:hypothetical protein